MACGQACQCTGYFSFAYSALASFRMGMSGSASLQRAKNFARQCGNQRKFSTRISSLPAQAAERAESNGPFKVGKRLHLTRGETQELKRRYFIEIKLPAGRYHGVLRDSHSTPLGASRGSTCIPNPDCTRAASLERAQVT